MPLHHQPSAPPSEHPCLPYPIFPSPITPFLSPPPPHKASRSFYTLPAALPRPVNTHGDFNGATTSGPEPSSPPGREKRHNGDSFSPHKSVSAGLMRPIS
ncbi:hypothetical protein E2C01_044145 [Portunus trituberculatus]|uniref:Uncharacterized protein n=1 Tax=Portunus trituberculatus TaxID=210409 RepID=A0A5B7FRB2_PORTR|nr:hypothetical protein [Portunus trituberculatus]